MIKIFKWLKEKKKEKYEDKIQYMISYNNYMINKYKMYPKKVQELITEYEKETGICMCYQEDFLNKIHIKYNINNDLIQQLMMSDKTALEEYHKMQERNQKIKEEKETREKIDLYKRAILELKKDGKI